MKLRNLRNKKKSIVIVINQKEYELQANWLYEHSKDKLIRDAYTNQLLIEAAEIPKNLKINQAILNKNCYKYVFLIKRLTNMRFLICTIKLMDKKMLRKNSCGIIKIQLFLNMIF